MGIGEMVGMRWVLWGGDPDGPSSTSRVPDEVFEQMMRFIQRGLGAPAEIAQGTRKDRT
jgi:hypothetical protein